MPTTLDLLNDAFSKQYQTFNEDTYYSLLFAYRRLIAAKLQDEETIRKLIELNSEQTNILQEWILKHPSYETEIFEEDWKAKNKKVSPFKE
jgi:hypothetical protein